MRRKERNEYIIKDIEARMKDLRDIIEQELRQEAESVVWSINMIKDNVEHIMLTIKQKQDATLNNNLVVRIQEIIKQLNDSRLTKIDSFCEFARKLEKHRSERFKSILKNAYQEMHDNMYLMPYEIQKFFGKKIQHLNEITMNNYHCYAELEMKLKLQMDEETRQWFQALKCGETMSKSVEEANRCSEEDTFNLMPEKVVNGTTKENIKMKLEKAAEDFRHLKQVAKNLCFLKSHPALEVFENYLDEMRKAVFCLFRSGLINHKGLSLDDETIRNLSNTNCMDEKDLQKIWQDGTKDMLKRLDNNTRSFRNSTRVFDFYFDRLEEMNTLYRQQLFLLVTKNDKQTMQMNSTMNLLIDTLRQDVGEQSLNKTLQQIKTTIQSIDTLIESHCREENAIVDKFVQFGMINIDILLDELARFVKQFVPPPNADPRIMKKRASWMNVDELRNNDHLFSRDFLECRFLMQGIDNWQFGVWQALITIMQTSKRIIASILRNWASTEKKKLTRRSELKITMNNVRMHNIRFDFWKIRLAEMKFHEERFLQHQVAIRENISQLAHLKNQMVETCTNFLTTEFNANVDEIMNGYPGIKKERHVLSIMNKLRGFNSSATLDMKNRHACFKNRYFSIMIDIRNSHIKLMRSIRLFSEDGNFTADEARILIKGAVSLEKLISKEFSNIEENTDRIYGDFSDACQKKLEVPFYTLHKVLEEFNFKDVIERKLKKLKREIGAAVLDIASEINKLDEKIRRFRQDAYSERNLGSYDFLFTFSRIFKEILAEIDSMVQRLHYCDSLAPNEKLLKQKIDLSQISLSPLQGSKPKKNSDEINIATTRKRSTKSISSLTKTKNYASILYPSVPPRQDGSFHPMLHLKTFVSYCDIQEVAKVFYDRRGDVLDDDRIPSDYKYFIDEILLKYKYYQLQLEFTWLECAIEVYNLLTNFRMFLGNYYTDTLLKYMNLRNEDLTETHSEVMRILEKDMKSVEDNYTSIHDKLKSMFGHPDNSRYLADLETYMNQAVEFNKRRLIDNLDPKKEIVKQHCIKTETFFLDMEKILSCMKGTSTLHGDCEELEEKLSERIVVMDKIISLDPDCFIDEMIEKDFVIDFKRRLQQYKMKAQIPSECLLPYTIIPQSSMSTTRSLHLDVEELIRNNYNKYEKISEEIENFRTKCSDIHNKYSKMWAQDIDIILNLYKIKYDNNNLD